MFDGFDKSFLYGKAILPQSFRYTTSKNREFTNQNVHDGRSPATVDRWFIHVYPIIHRVPAILSVLQDVACHHRTGASIWMARAIGWVL